MAKPTIAKAVLEEAKQGKVNLYNEDNAIESLIEKGTYKALPQILRQLRNTLPHDDLFGAPKNTHIQGSIAQTLNNFSSQLIEIVSLAVKARLTEKEDDAGWYPKHLPEGKRTEKDREEYQRRRKELRAVFNNPKAQEKLLMQYTFDKLSECAIELSAHIEKAKQSEHPADKAILATANEKYKSLEGMMTQISNQPDFRYVVAAFKSKLSSEYKDFREQANIAKAKLLAYVLEFIQGYEQFLQGFLLANNILLEQPINFYQKIKQASDVYEGFKSVLNKWETAVVSQILIRQDLPADTKYNFVKGRNNLEAIGKALNKIEQILNNEGLTAEQGFGELYNIMQFVEKSIQGFETSAAPGNMKMAVARDKITAVQDNANVVGEKYIANLSKTLLNSAAQKDKNKKAEIEHKRVLKLAEEFRLKMRQVSQAALKKRTFFGITLSRFVPVEKLNKEERIATLMEGKVTCITQMQLHEMDNLNKQLKQMVEDANYISEHDLKTAEAMLVNFDETTQLFLEKMIILLQPDAAALKGNFAAFLKRQEVIDLPERQSFTGIKILSGILGDVDLEQAYKLLCVFHAKNMLNNEIKKNVVAYYKAADSLYENQKEKGWTRIFDFQAKFLLNEVRSTKQYITDLGRYSTAIAKGTNEYQDSIQERKRNSFILA